jgi:hypothetical protein
MDRVAFTSRAIGEGLLPPEAKPSPIEVAVQGLFQACAPLEGIGRYEEATSSRVFNELRGRVCIICPQDLNTIRATIRAASDRDDYLKDELLSHIAIVLANLGFFDEARRCLEGFNHLNFYLRRWAQNTIFRLESKVLSEEQRLKQSLQQFFADNPDLSPNDLPKNFRTPQRLKPTDFAELFANLSNERVRSLRLGALTTDDHLSHWSNGLKSAILSLTEALENPEIDLDLLNVEVALFAIYVAGDYPELPEHFVWLFQHAKNPEELVLFATHFCSHKPRFTIKLCLHLADQGLYDEAKMYSKAVQGYYRAPDIVLGYIDKQLTSSRIGQGNSSGDRTLLFQVFQVIELINKKLVQEARLAAEQIPSGDYKELALEIILEHVDAAELPLPDPKPLPIKETIQLLFQINAPLKHYGNDESGRSRVLDAIQAHVRILGQQDLSTINAAIRSAPGRNDYDKDSLLSSVAIALANLELFDEARRCLEGFKYECDNLSLRRKAKEEIFRLESKVLSEEQRLQQSLQQLFADNPDLSPNDLPKNFRTPQRLEPTDFAELFANLSNERVRSLRLGALTTEDHLSHWSDGLKSAIFLLIEDLENPEIDFDRFKAKVALFTFYVAEDYPDFLQDFVWLFQHVTNPQTFARFAFFLSFHNPQLSIRLCLHLVDQGLYDEAKVYTKAIRDPDRTLALVLYIDKQLTSSGIGQGSSPGDRTLLFQVFQVIEFLENNLIQEARTAAEQIPSGDYKEFALKKIKEHVALITSLRII